MKDRHILILTHGNWGEECVRGAEMIIGKIQDLSAYSLEPSDNLDELIEYIEKDIKERHIEHPIVISDLKDGSTSHGATYIAHVSGGLAVSGLNLSLLITAVNERGECDEGRLYELMLQRGKENISNISIKG
ncbi:PTS sugar transporter subunit IIA [Luxibacter massiliensis]|uniref:PTS sugar transporter subunit IIA n=1 Tax=Luxibacter massiliensis TaxID=2219695 RepID=UPI000F053400|nr:hypothetical protein [Luxibacter massiliensis]